MSIYLYLSLFISIYLYLSLFISIDLYLSLFISICLYLSLFISIYLYLSIISPYLCLSISRCIYSSISLFIYSSIHLFINLSIYLSIYLFNYLSIYLFIYLWLLSWNIWNIMNQKHKMTLCWVTAVTSVDWIQNFMWCRDFSLQLQVKPQQVLFWHACVQSHVHYIIFKCWLDFSHCWHVQILNNTFQQCIVNIQSFSFWTSPSMTWWFPWDWTVGIHASLQFLPCKNPRSKPCGQPTQTGPATHGSRV